MTTRSSILKSLDNKIENPLSDSNSQSTDATIRGDSPSRLPSTPPPKAKAGTRTTIPAVDPFTPPPPNEYISTCPSPSYSPPPRTSSPSAMPPKRKPSTKSSTSKSPPVKIEKSRAVKRNYQRRKQGFKFSSQELRQIERNEELKKRADKIKEKERRAKVNKQKKEEKERKGREERARLGIKEPVAKVDPAQTRLSQLFGGDKKKAVEKECSDVEEESCDDGMQHLPPFPVPAVVDEDGDSEMSDAEETVAKLGTGVVSDHHSPSPAAHGIDNSAAKPKTLDPSALPDDWVVYFDSNSQVEKDLAGDQGFAAALAPIKSLKATGLLTSKTSTTTAQEQLLPRKVLNPKAPSSKPNITKQDVAAEVLNMMSSQDLTSDKENIDPAQPKPDDKSPDHTSSSKKSKRSHEETLGDDEDKENMAPKAKQPKRTPLEVLYEISDAVTTEEEALRERQVLEVGKPAPRNTLQPGAALPQPSSQDEYGLKDVEEADLIAEVEKVETPCPRTKFEPNFSQDEYDWNDLDGLEAEILAKIQKVESAVNGSSVIQGPSSGTPSHSPTSKQSSSQEYGLDQSKSFNEALLAEVDSFETPREAQPTEAATPSQVEYGLSSSPAFENALIDELDRHESPARPAPRKAAPKKHESPASAPRKVAAKKHVSSARPVSRTVAAENHYSPARPASRKVTPNKSSNEDEYGSADFDALNAEMVAQTEGVESREGIKALGASLSSQGWFRDMMGTQELRDIGLG